MKAEHVGLPKSVLATTDFSPVSMKSIKEGFWVAAKAQASFHLVHVIDTDDLPTAVEEYVNRAHIQEEIETRLRGILDSLAIPHQRVQLHVLTGSPWQELSQLAHQLNVDLISMGTVGRGGIPGLLLGNTAEKVLRTCECSILTVKPDGFQSPIQIEK